MSVKVLGLIDEANCRWDAELALLYRVPSSQVNVISIALNHSSSLKGLHRTCGPSDGDDTPLAQAPLRASN